MARQVFVHFGQGPGGLARQDAFGGQVAVNTGPDKVVFPVVADVHQNPRDYLFYIHEGIGTLAGSCR